MTAWLSHHKHGIGVALARFGAAPLGNVLTILALGIALSLPLGLYVLIENIQAASQRFAGEPQITVFLDVSATAADIAKVEARLKQDGRVRDFKFIPKDAALQQLKQASGLADVIDGLPQNPLPDAYVVNALDTKVSTLEALRDAMKAWPGVAQAQLDTSWAQRLEAALKLGRWLMLALGIFLGLALIAVTFNTVRLQVLIRREEIEVIKLIGATDAFIRRPFLYYGAIQGAAEALVAWAIVAGGLHFINVNLGELAQVYASVVEFHAPTVVESVLLVVGIVLVNCLGAHLSVDRHLALIDSSTHSK